MSSEELLAVAFYDSFYTSHGNDVGPNSHRL
jgi:hypothetical protein